MFCFAGMESIFSNRMDGGIAMARKSRKNKNIESKIQITAPKENLLDTAAYIRLSVENGGNETDETLVVQQMLVEKFIEQHPELRLEDVYIDNGFSGTNFERPGFMRLMEDVRSGKIQCIVVKDLSRFGRDYLETGYYLETILPKLNVRFIAITDDYDSSRKEDRENISVPIKNMVNAMYAKDMSKKILAAKEARQRSGNITLSKVAFGYVRSKDKTRQIVDESVAPAVRMIFQWTLLGNSKKEIADRLNLLGIATPGQKEKKKVTKVPLNETKWNSGTVRKILENQTYTGDIITGKLKQSLYKGVKQYHTAPEDWNIQKDMHMPLVARDDYEELQADREEIHKITRKRQFRYEKDREKYQDSFPGMVRCGECGKTMYFRRYTHNYTTNERMGGGYHCSSEQESCHGHKIEGNLLKILVMDQIQNLIRSMCDRKQLLQKMQNETKEKNIFYEAAAKVRILERKIAQTEERNMCLYEDYVAGIVEKDDFDMMKERYIRELQNLREEIQTEKQNQRILEKKVNRYMDMVTHLEKYLDKREYNEKLVQEQVEYIEVFTDGSIHICFKCNDGFQQIAREMEGVQIG